MPADAALCDQCNPLELSQPSATQMHGIAAVGIIGFVVVLAFLARFALAGTGPFTGQVVDVAPAAGGGLAVTLVVANEGSNAAATTCAVSETPTRPGGQTQTVQTPLVPAGESLRFTATVTKLGGTPVALTAVCQSP